MKRTAFALLLTPIAAATAVNAAEPAPAAPVQRVYIGTYSGGDTGSRGIYKMDLDLATGKLTEPELAAEAANPSFLAIHPSKKFLYAVGELGDFQGRKDGAVAAFAIDGASGSLTPLNVRPSGGAAPCHLVVDRSGKSALLANYSGGSVAALPIGEDGRLGQATAFVQHQGKGNDPRRQEGPHAHSINLDAANRFAVAADLGLDKLLVYRFDPKAGSLAPNDPPSASVAPGSGPRHFAFHPDGKHAYVINEMALTVTAFDYDPDRGVLAETQTISTLPQGTEKIPAYSTAEIQVHPSGKFVYGSNRGHDTIAIFGVDSTTGKLSPAGHVSTGGKTPRNFGIDPTGAYLLAANQSSGSVVVFKIDQATGNLTPTGQTVKVGAPVCVKFLPLDDR